MYNSDRDPLQNMIFKKNNFMVWLFKFCLFGEGLRQSCLWQSLALNSWQSSRLIFPNVGILGELHHAQHFNSLVIIFDDIWLPIFLLLLSLQVLYQKICNTIFQTFISIFSLQFHGLYIPVYDFFLGETFKNITWD